MRHNLAVGSVVWCTLSLEPLDGNAMTTAVRSSTLGGVVLFEGDVRSLTGEIPTKALHYEAYEDMALSQMRQIGEEAASRWSANVAIAHRTGELQPGEAAVICVAACGHRADAFECCRFLIDRIKEDVPIWKKESGF